MTAIQASVEDYEFLPLDEAQRPSEPGAYMHYVDSWWVVHPELGLAFWNPVGRRSGRRRSEGLGAPLCNSSEAIQRHMARGLAEDAGWPAEAVLVESAWVPAKTPGCL
jgi:hypothetical protein